MNAPRIHRRSGSASRQRGVAMYLLVIIAAVTMTALAAGAIGLLDAGRASADEQQRVLDEAKRLLLAHLANPDFDPATPRRLGEPALLPDLPIAAGPGADAAEPNYDGDGETSGCAARGWVPGMALRMPDVSGPAARCFGRFPWRALGLAITSPDPQGDAGLVPWIVLSPNLLSRLYLRDLTPTTLSEPHAGYGLTNRPPYPWIVVRDARGNLLSSRVAAALILPGTALPGQNRTAIAGPAAWLDSLTVAPTCVAPCQPGTYDNAAYNAPDGTPTTLVNGPRDRSSATRSGVYVEPLLFNDRVVWISVEELLAALEKRARATLLGSLERFRAVNGYYPFAAPLDSTDGSCVSGQRFGHPPALDGSCGHALALPAWFTDAGWHRWFVYAASPRCSAGNTACNAPGIVIDLAGGGSIDTANAVIVSPGAPIVTAPFAASRAGPQLRANATTFSADPRDWLDSPISANSGGLRFVQTEGQPAPSNDRLEILQ